MKIGISTLAFGNRTKEEIETIARKNDWIIEFSSSFPFEEDMIAFFTETSIKRFAHNYFPAPREPFVINLASSNEKIRNCSIAHCLQGLKLSKQCGAPYFSAHAGFCIDPQPGQLGKPLNINVAFEREANWKLFKKSLDSILMEAEKLNLSFLVENNVTAKFNLRDDGKEVLFCSRPEEMIALANEINSERFGLLLDTAHLKVSANALKFNMNDAVEAIKPHVKYVHHSDNKGDRDTNESIDASYWFLPQMKNFKDCVHILEVKNLDAQQIEDQISLLYQHGQ